MDITRSVSCYLWCTELEPGRLQISGNLLFMNVSYILSGCQSDSHVCSAVMINHILRGLETLWWELTKRFVMILSSLNLLLHILTSRTLCPSSWGWFYLLVCFCQRSVYSSLTKWLLCVSDNIKLQSEEVFTESISKAIWPTLEFDRT